MPFLIAALLIGPLDETGEELQYWTYSSIVYANIVAVRTTHPDQDPKPGVIRAGLGEIAVTLRPLATVAGWFDCSDVPGGQMEVRAIVHPTISALLNVPEIDSNVLVVLSRHPPSLREQLPGADIDFHAVWVSSNHIRYFPPELFNGKPSGYPPIVKVKDFNDPIVAQVRAEVQKRRARANAPKQPQ